MVKSKKKNKNKHKNKKKGITRYQKFSLILLGIILVILIILVGYKVCTKYIFKDNEKEIKVTENKAIELDNYDYYLHGNATSYEQSLAEELKQVLSNESINEEEYAKVITKLFISDLFTLNNKNSSSDITSSQYVYDGFKETYITMVKDTIYSSIEVNLDGTRTQSLPKVKNVEINTVTNDKFLYNDEVLDSNAYYVSATIEYETDLGYPTTYNVVLVKNNDLLQVVKTKG